MQIRVEVCDVCQDPNKPVEHYRVGLPNQRLRSLALCVDDATPLAEFGSTIAKRATKRVMSMEEIEKMRRPTALPGPAKTRAATKKATRTTTPARK